MNIQKKPELKRIVATPAEEKPKFNWKRLVETDGSCACAYCSAGEIAEKIGEALINASLLGTQADIFSEENKKLIIYLTSQICERVNGHTSSQLTQTLLDNIIEEVLVRNKAKEMACAFVAKCRFENEYYKRLKEGRKLSLIRRDGTIVPWNIEKIKHAVELAFIAQNRTTEKAEEISRAVTKDILDEDLSYIHIENVQDCVQEELMRQGEYKIAEAYILYRAERAKLRKSSFLEHEKTDASEPEEPIILIKDESGSSFFWDGSELCKRIKFANDGLDSHLTFDEIFLSLRENIPPEITISELRDCIIKNSRLLIEKDPALAVFAARMQLLYLYEDILQWNCATDTFDSLAKKQAAAFVRYIKTGVADGFLHENMLKYDLEKLSEVLNIACDREFDAIAIQGLQENYFMRGLDNQILETPQMLWMRVAMGVFLAKEDAEDDVIALYELMRDRKFCLATPTLYYAGTPKAQMMSSYIFHVEDDMQSIMTRGISDNAFIAKWGGGIAGSWTNVRGKGSRISGTRGEAPGVIPFLQLHQHQLAIANQGTERRRGRGVAYLEVWHNDILDFINYKKKHGMPGVQNDSLGTVLWVPDIFMRRLENEGDWTLFNSEDAYILHELCGEKFDEKYEEMERLVVTGKISGNRIGCREIWQKVMQRIFEAGYPKIAFKDTCNRANMCKDGIIHAAGLCLEHIMNTNSEETAVCNTGALDISKHLQQDGSLDRDDLRHSIAIATRALDALIDANFFPSEASEKFAKKYRAVGLGIMGLQNAFYRKNLPFGDMEAIEFGEECAEFISHETINESCKLAEKYGPCEAFESSEWKNGSMPFDFSTYRGGGKIDWDAIRSRIKKNGLRNAYLNAFSPTRKIARLLGCYPELSPATKNVFTKRLDDNYEMMIISPELVKILKKSGVWNKAIHKQIRYFEGELAAIEGIPESIKSVFSTAYMIDSEAIIEGAARRQRWIDQSQSLRLFLGSPNLKTLSSMFILAWRSGIKGIYEIKFAGFFSETSSTEKCSEGQNYAAANGVSRSDGADAMIKILEKFHGTGEK
ncbi:MAG: ribonucleoside-diphosphate reductase subunit alpha [Puniceicoccales bacterium]|jgi:ribonucleoside-diphosphate reductase alpha chain|nr:ribonucleoside-diphosphate reductase subunit alpha [Puniceicoccales bacterium]